MNRTDCRTEQIIQQPNPRTQPITQTKRHGSRYSFISTLYICVKGRRDWKGTPPPLPPIFSIDRHNIDNQNDDRKIIVGSASPLPCFKKKNSTDVNACTCVPTMTQTSVYTVSSDQFQFLVRELNGDRLNTCIWGNFVIYRECLYL